MTYSELESAYSFVSGSAPGDNEALVSRTAGEIYYRSMSADIDEIPEDAENSDDYIEVPHKHDLDLGKQLVLDFVQLKCPAEINDVRDIFSRRGAYQRYKNFLDNRRLLDAWHAFENERTKAALLEWCDEVGLVLEEEKR